MQNSVDSIALIICTRNRPNFMSGLLENLDSLTTTPGKILIVDSSEDNLTLDLIASSKLCVAKKVLYIKSAPGLPHQRNEGIRTILSRNEFDQVKIVSFTDDDCRLSIDYFKHLSALLETNLNFSAVTGILVPDRRMEPSLLRRIFLLDSRSSGSVLKSGLTTPIQCLSGLSEVDWIPGGSMNIKRVALESREFDGQLRMYGEDLKMSLMLKEYGPLFAHARMEYEHLEATSGKDNLEDIISFTDGIRWQLSLEFPSQIQRKYILWSIFGSVIANMIVSVKRKQQNQVNRSIIRGHIHFLQRLVTGKPYVQKKT